jgi:hypothetical protein
MPKVTRESPNGAGPTRRGGGVLDRIVDVGEGTKLDRFFIFGESGSGKTRLACKWPKPLLLIGAEDGRESVKNVTGVKFVRLHSPDEIADLIEDARTHRWKTVVLDTVTSFHGMVLAKVKGLTELPVQRSYGDATRDDYREASFVIKQYIRDILRLGEEDGLDAGLVTPRIKGAVGESVVDYINAECDYVVHCEIRPKFKVTREEIDGEVVEMREPLDDVEYCVRLRPNKHYVVKFRVPDNVVVPEFLADADYEKLHRYIDPQP